MSSEYLIGAGLLGLLFFGFVFVVVWLIRDSVLTWKERAEAGAYDRGYETGYEAGKARGKAEAETKAEQEKRRKVSSNMAYDFPTADPFEFVYTQGEIVSLQAEVIIHDNDLKTTTKEYVKTELAKQIYGEAIRFIDIQRVEDPLLYGTRLRGVLRIVKVNR